MKEAQHPIDFSPLLDGDVADVRYGEIRTHLESCPACRTQVESWRHVDHLFRSPDLDIDVAPWQWSRIQSRLEKSRARAGWLGSLGRLAPRYVWAAGASLVIIASVAAGVRQYRHSAEQQTLVAVARFAETEQLRLRAAGNPFRNDQVSLDNPFTRYQSGRTRNQNPFARR